MDFMASKSSALTECYALMDSMASSEQESVAANPKRAVGAANPKRWR